MRLGGGGEAADGAARPILATRVDEAIVQEVQGHEPVREIVAGKTWQRQASAAGNTKAAQLALCLELSMWGFAACGMSGGFLITWFPYLLIGLVAATKEIFKGDPAAGTEL